MRTPIRFRAAAEADITETIREYVASAGAGVAERFVDDLEQEADRLRGAPRVGSLRFAFELGVPGLRVWPLRDFPFVIVYVESSEWVEVLRVLHTRRDIAASMSPDEGVSPQR